MWPFSTSQASSSSSSSLPSPPSHPPPTGNAEDRCPVDHETRAAWLRANPGSQSPFVQAASSTTQDSESDPSHAPATPLPNVPVSRRLSTDRVVSSIPREYRNIPSPSPESSSESPRPVDPSTEANWVYPSELQFFQAMMRKNHNPNAADMGTIVPIHNAVNERAWAELLKWEKGMGGEKCGGVKLISFKGRPRDRTPKAWINTALGYSAPFDRHDWVISRCGQQIRYVIDFYTGRPPSSSAASSTTTTASSGLPSKDAGNLSFYLDVRPALDGWEGTRMRLSKLFGVL